jgi:CHAT domain-containing protein
MDRSRESLSLALVAEQQALDPGLAVISGVNQEVEGVAALTEMYGIKKVSLLAGSTTTMNTRSAMKASNIVHLACHGVQDPDDATNSGFCLGDGRLTISQLMDLHVNDPFLAFLSACETAKGDKTQPDQAMHLAAAMLFCGYTSVVATMW